MSNRDHWKFQYGANVLHQAAQAKRQHHTERQLWWEAKKKDIFEQIKAEGLEVDESLAEHISNSYNRNAEVRVRADLLSDLRECQDKIREHREKVSDYYGWCEVLADQGQSACECSHEDWLFFFSKS